MLEKLYELWSIEKRVSVTIKSVGLNLSLIHILYDSMPAPPRIVSKAVLNSS